MRTQQEDHWAGEFGKDYSLRNFYEPDELDDLYKARYGITRTQLNSKFLVGLPHSMRILEVGCNLGNQLALLLSMGYSDVHGLEISETSAERAAERLPSASVTVGSALDLPFESNSFDLVFTSGVLIHITPVDLDRALKEVVRCARRHIWGFEYWARENTPISYRDRAELLWKDDFAARYVECCPSLRINLEERYAYTSGPEIDTMFLLEQTDAACRHGE